MPETPSGAAPLFALFVGAAVVLEDELVGHAIHEGDHAEGEFVFEVEDEAEGEVLGNLRD